MSSWRKTPLHCDPPTLQPVVWGAGNPLPPGTWEGKRIHGPAKGDMVCWWGARGLPRDAQTSPRGGQTPSTTGVKGKSTRRPGAPVRKRVAWARLGHALGRAGSTAVAQAAGSGVKGKSTCGPGCCARRRARARRAARREHDGKHGAAHLRCGDTPCLEGYVRSTPRMTPLIFRGA